MKFNSYSQKHLQTNHDPYRIRLKMVSRNESTEHISHIDSPKIKNIDIKHENVDK